MPPIRLGIIGCGAIVRAQHLPALLRTRAFDLVALADPSRAAASATAAAWPGVPPAHHTDHLALLAAGSCDAVLVATPNNSHAAIVADCLEAGVHVLCEKPVAFTVEEHDRLAAMARARDRIVQVGLVFRYSSVFQHVDELLRRELGSPLMMFINEFRPFAFSPWRYDRGVSGGMFIEKNCHHFDLFNRFLGDVVRPRRVAAMGGQAVLKGEPREVWCLRDRTVLPASDVIDHAWVLIEYEDDVCAQLGISFFAPWGREFRVGLMGAEWKVDVYEMERLVYVHRDAAMKEQRFPPDPAGRAWQEQAGYDDEGAVHTGAVQQWRDFARCVRTGEPPACDLVKARESIRLAVAADRALREGRVVEV